MLKKRLSGWVSALLLIAGTLLSPYAAGAQSDNSWDQVFTRGSEALDKGEYWIAEPSLKQAVAQARYFGVNDMRLAKSLGQLGLLYRIRGRFHDAEPCYEEQLQVTEVSLGAGSDQIVPAMGSLIRFYLLYGTTSKADPLAEDVLAFVEGKLKDPTAISQSHKFQKGVPLQGWAGSAANNMRDPVLDWAITCDELGELYRTRGNLDLAQRLFQSALTVKSTVLGKEHLSLANSYNSLGEICEARNDDAGAESYFRDALSYTERILEPSDPQVYSRLDRLARCYIKMGKYKDAEDLYIRAENFWKAEPSKCGNEARDLYALGSLYAQQKEYATAAPILEKALSLAQDFYGPDSAVLVPYLQRYAYSLYYLGRTPESKELNARASTISGTRSG